MTCQSGLSLEAADKPFYVTLERGFDSLWKESLVFSAF